MKKRTIKKRENEKKKMLCNLLGSQGEPTRSREGTQCIKEERRKVYTINAQRGTWIPGRKKKPIKWRN